MRKVILLFTSSIVLCLLLSGCTDSLDLTISEGKTIKVGMAIMAGEDVIFDDKVNITKDGDVNVLEATEQVLTSQDIAYSHHGGFIKGIGDYQKDREWVASVNGKNLQGASFKYKVKDGDKISWQYKSVFKAPVVGVVENANTALVSRIKAVNTDSGEIAYYFTDLDGGFRFELAKGTYDITFSKGSMYSTRTLHLAASGTKAVDLGVIELAFQPEHQKLGWYAGDLHQHSNYSDGKNNVHEVVISNLAAGAAYGFLTDHNEVGGLEIWNNSKLLQGYGGIEITTEMGHFNALGYDKVYKWDFSNEREGILAMIETVQNAGGFIQMNHPFAVGLLGYRGHWDLASHFDGIEVWNGKAKINTGENLKTKKKWFELLNAGYRITATGGSDNHDIYGGYEYARIDEQFRGLLSGQPYTFVNVKELTKESVIAALKNGHSYLSNGPLIDFRIDGKVSGYEVNRASAELTININSSNDVITEVKLIENGEILETFKPNPDSLDVTKTIALKNDSWYLLEVIGEHQTYALTNPIYVSY